MSGLLIPPSNIEIMKEDLGATCWFCEKQQSSPETAHFVELWDPFSVKSGVNRKTWTKISVPIPQCKVCAANKRKEKTSIVLFTFLVFLLGGAGLGIGIPLEGRMGEEAPPIAVIMMFAGIAVAIGLFILMTLRRKKQSPVQFGARRDLKNHPRIKKLVEEGWKLGPGPT